MVNRIQLSSMMLLCTTMQHTQSAIGKVAALGKSIIPSQEALKQKVINLDLRVSSQTSGRSKLVDNVAASIQNTAASVAPKLVSPVRTSALKSTEPQALLTYEQHSDHLLKATARIDDPINYFKEVETDFVRNAMHYCLMQFILEDVCKIEAPKQMDIYSDIIRKKQLDSPIKHLFFSFLDKTDISLIKRWKAKFLYNVGHFAMNYVMKAATHYLFSNASSIVKDILVKYLGPETYNRLKDEKDMMAIETYQHITPNNLQEFAYTGIPFTIKVRSAFNSLINKSNKGVSVIFRILSYATQGFVFIVDSIRNYFMKKYGKRLAYDLIEYMCNKKIVPLLTEKNPFSYAGFKILNGIILDLIKEAEKREMLFADNDFLVNNHELNDLLKLMIEKLLTVPVNKESSFYQRAKASLNNYAIGKGSSTTSRLASCLIRPVCNLFLDEKNPYVEKQVAQLMDVINISFQENAPEIADEEFKKARTAFEKNLAIFITMILGHYIAPQDDNARGVISLTPNLLKNISRWSSQQGIELLYRNTIIPMVRGLLDPTYIYRSIFNEAPLS